MNKPTDFEKKCQWFTYGAIFGMVLMTLTVAVIVLW